MRKCHREGSQDDTQSQEKLRDKAVFKGTET